MPGKVLVSFATRPGHGSEGGVGWAFLLAGLDWAIRHDERVYVIVDGRDASDIRAALAAVDRGEYISLHPIEIPAWARRRYGDARTRLTYLSWIRAARAEVVRLLASTDANVVHQVTFASAVLPSAMPVIPGVKRVWGPLSVPWASVQSGSAISNKLARTMPALARRVAALNTRAMSLLIATNERTASFFAKSTDIGPNLDVEPNVVVEPQDLANILPNDKLLSFMGMLTELKRPSLAIQALTHPVLRGFELQIIGDGPLRSQMEELANSLSLQKRVRFLGWLPRHEALRELAKSRVLVHPSVREGASWAVGEAAAMGVPAVVFDDVGAATTVRLSANGGVVCERDAITASRALADAVAAAAQGPRPEPSARWSASRLPALLDQWWRTEGTPE